MSEIASQLRKTISGDGHDWRSSPNHLRSIAASGIDRSRRLARPAGPSPLLRQFGLQWRRADRRKPRRPTRPHHRPALCLSGELSGFRQGVGQQIKARRDCSRRAVVFSLAGPGAGSALKGQISRLRGLKRLSGRSQRGDSAWNKTLDHLLSLLMETSIYAANSDLLSSRTGPR
jgi:hypothetical protein